MEAQEQAVSTVLAEAEQCLLQQDAQCAQESQQSLADFAEPCNGETNSVLVDALIEQAIELFYVIVSAQGEEGVMTTEISPLLDLFATIAEKTCDGSIDLFDILLELCGAVNFSPDVGADALNKLYEKLLEKSNSTSLLDSALDIALCLQRTATSTDSICSEKEAVQYDGEGVTYYVFNVPIAELNGPDRTLLTTPSVSLSLPPFFIEQVADNLNGTGVRTEELFTIPCISFHFVTARVADPCIGSLCEEGSSLGSDGVAGIDFYLERSVPIRLHLSHLKDVQVLLLQRGSASPTRQLPSAVGWHRDLSNPRFALTEDSTTEASDCAYYDGVGEFTLDCVFLFEKTTSTGIVTHCECPHFSNFGVIFSGESGNESWTTYRILSLALLCGLWVLILLFMCTTCVSTRFQEFFHLETQRRNNKRVLGRAVDD